MNEEYEFFFFFVESMFDDDDKTEFWTCLTHVRGMASQSEDEMRTERSERREQRARKIQKKKKQPEPTTRTNFVRNYA